jgi:hypothetical protein
MTSFERKTMENGKKNPKYIDVLDEDTITVPGQKFGCMSFISPEKVLKKREMFLFEQFVKQWDMSKSMEKFVEFVNFISFKYSLNVENVIADYNDFIKEEEKKLKEDSMSVENDYKNFLDKNEERLNTRFNSENEFLTSVRGLKIRGVFPTQEEAELHCKKLRERDPNHDIFVAPTGTWLPWDPDAYKTGRTEFMEEELNQLYQEKMKNEAKAKEEMEKRVKDTKRKAIEENIKKAKQSGNKITQVLDPEGNLVGVNTMNFEDRVVADPKERDEVLKETIEHAIHAESASPSYKPSGDSA